MFENALTLRNVSSGREIVCKTLLSAGLIALAVVLPQIMHLALGRPGGVKWLPMYLPVLIGGCLLGTKWGFAVGVLSPMVSFMITSIMGNPMPMAARLPFMMAELAVFAVISGLFTKKISRTPFNVSMIWSQIQTGVTGLLAQAILVPVIIIGLRQFLIKESKND